MVKAHDRHQGRKATVGNRHLVEGSTIRIEIGTGLPRDVRSFTMRGSCVAIWEGCVDNESESR
jgi:hypothetical protein